METKDTLWKLFESTGNISYYSMYYRVSKEKPNGRKN